MPNRRSSDENDDDDDDDDGSPGVSSMVEMELSDEDRAIDAILQRRDDRAFELLYQRYGNRFYKFLLRITAGDRDLSDDLYQESWILALTRLARFERRSTFYSWLVGIAVNLHRSFVRSLRRGEHHPLELDEPETPDDRGETPPELTTLDRQEPRLDAEALLKKLPEGYRMVLVLHVEGYTHEEIGELLSISAGTSKSQLSRARRAAHRLLLQGESA